MLNWLHIQDNQRALLWIAAMALFICGVTLSFKDQVGAATVTYAASVVVLIFSFLARFKRFKGLGVEAELWETEMEQAAEVRRKLQDLSLQLAELTYFQLGPGSRMGHIPEKQKIGLVERLEETLEGAGLGRDAIEQIKSPWHKCLMYDQANPIAVQLRDAVEEKIKVVKDEIGALGSPVPAESLSEHARLVKKQRTMSETISGLNGLVWQDKWERVPGLLREAIDNNLWLAPDERQTIYDDCREQFSDIDYYVRERKLRRPESLPD